MDFKDFDKEQQAFITDKTISGNKTIKEWQDFFNPLALFDKRDDAVRRNGNYLMAIWSFFLLFGVYMALMYLFAEMPVPELIPPAIIIAVSSLLMVLTTQWFKKYETWDIPNLMRGFLVPYLDYIEKKAGAQTEMELNMDLKGIYDLTDVEVEERTTEKFNYLQTSVRLSDSGTAVLSLEGMGTKRPYYSKYKLVHFMDISVKYDQSLFDIASDNEDFPVEEKDGKIIISDKYEESSNSPIEEDTGPDLENFSERLRAIRHMVVKKSSGVEINKK